MVKDLKYNLQHHYLHVLWNLNLPQSHHPILWAKPHPNKYLQNFSKILLDQQEWRAICNQKVIKIRTFR